MVNINNNGESEVCRIVARLSIGGLYFGRSRGWHWKKRMIFRPRMDFGGMLNNNLMITGSSGSGKSNACKLIVESLAGSGSRFLILDPHGEYSGIAGRLKARAYDALESSINLFEVGSSSEYEKSAELAQLFKKAFRLGEVQSSMLFRCIRYTFYICRKKGKEPGMNELLYSIRAFKEQADKSEAAALSSLLNRLSMLGNRDRKHLDFNEVWDGNTVLVLSRLHSSEAQVIYIESILRKVYSSMLEGGRRSEKFYIIIDEAEKLLDTEILARIAAEGRKYSVGIIAIAQRPKGLCRSIRSNSAVSICFQQREPEELNYLSNLVAGGNEANRFAEVKKAIRDLGKGFAVIQKSGEEPCIARFGLFDEGADIGLLIMERARSAISAEELSALMKTNRIKEVELRGVLEALERKGMLKKHEVEAGRFAGLWYISGSRNSSEHDVIVALISRKLKLLGVRNYLYNRPFGPDVVAYANGFAIAIEYETGSKSAEKSLEMIRKRVMHYRKVVLVVDSRRIGHYSIFSGVSSVISYQDFFELEETGLSNLFFG